MFQAKLTTGFKPASLLSCLNYSHLLIDLTQFIALLSLVVDGGIWAFLSHFSTLVIEIHNHILGLRQTAIATLVVRQVAQILDVR